MAKTQHGSDLTGSELGEMVDEFVNNGPTGGSTVKSVVEQIVIRTHRTLQQKIMGLVIALLEGWAKAYEEKNYDGRNERTCELAHKMIAATGDKYDRTLPYI